MDYAFQIFLIIHLIALVFGTATTVAMPVVMREMAGATPESRKMLGAIGARLSLNSRIAFLVLLLSGPAMVFVRYGGLSGMSPWFFAKLGLVALIVTLIVISLVAPARALNPRLFGWMTRLTLLGIVVSSVLAFT